jgi:ABC-type lipoprotein export system ATPase subunit
VTAPLVEVKDLVKRFEALEQVPPVLDGIDLEIRAGESLAIVGPSGSGKSTLLNIIGALMPASSGQVLFDGSDLSRAGADELADLRNNEIGYVFQSHHLLPQCTALENVLIPTLAGRDKEKRRGKIDRARSLLSAVGLGDRASHRPAHLSGGECQRVAVVRALINEPRLLLADEPTGSLDARAADQLGELLCSLNERESVALVTVTHSERLAGLMQRVYELREGKLAPYRIKVEP